MALSRVFVANRGEIAVRIVRACQSLGLESVVGVSDVDRDGFAAELADRAVVLGPAPARDSYLNANLLVHAAKATACDALHPGYGFLSESAALAALCEWEGIAFVGPRAETIERLGDKLSARAIAAEANVPIVPGSGEIRSTAEASSFAASVGYPVLLKASAGGGGRGMFVARAEADIDGGFERASAEAEAAFGDGALFVERFVEDARHVEVQIMGDGAGAVVHYGERDCSVQRRFQKIVEEAPSPAVDPSLRARMAGAALALVERERYRGAGTVEFILAPDGAFYFLEMNTRIQVEHPATEMITGLDLVGLQLRLARGEDLSELSAPADGPEGHAIECRIYAENPDRNFRPSPGLLERFAPPPEGNGIRLDTGVAEGDRITPYYDPMIAKLVAHGGDRAAAIDKMLTALGEFRIEGIVTNIDFLRRVVDHDAFRAGHTHTGFVDEHRSDLMAA